MSDYDDLAYKLRKPLAAYFHGFTNLDLGRGSSFPTTGHDGAAVQSGARFYRTDINLACYYTGAEWLTQSEYTMPLAIGDTAYTHAYTATQNVMRFSSMRNDYKPIFTRAAAALFHTTNTGANYFTYTFKDNLGTTLWTFNTSGDGTGEVYKSTTSFTQPSGVITFVYLNIAATGSPNHIPRTPVFYYKLVIP